MIGRLPQVLPTPSAAYSLPPSFFEVPLPTSTCLAEHSPFELCPSVLNTLGHFSSSLSSLLLNEPFVRGRPCYLQCQEIITRRPLCRRANTTIGQMTPDNAFRFIRPAYLTKPDMGRLWFKKNAVLRKMKDGKVVEGMVSHVHAFADVKFADLSAIQPIAENCRFLRFSCTKMRRHTAY